MVFFFRESNNSLLGIFGAKSMTGDKVLDHVFRNAPPQYEIVIRNGSNQNFVNLHLELGKWTNNMHSEIVGRLSQLGYELPYPEEMETDEAALKIHDEIKQEFYPEGIRLINQLAPFHERPDFVFPRPENGTNYSGRNLIIGMKILSIKYYQYLMNITNNEEWNDMMFDIANMQVLADKDNGTGRQISIYR